MSKTELTHLAARQTDCMTAAIDALPQVTNAVGHRVSVFFDGGIRCGPNILAALCLGARFCFVGRATLYGVMAGGRAGADRAIQILREEVSHTMAMIGCPTIEQLGREFLVKPDERGATEHGPGRPPPTAGC